MLKKRDINITQKHISSIFLLGVLAISAYTSSVMSGNFNASADPACENQKITKVTANGHDGNVPENVIDNKLTTRWSNYGIGSWILADLGEQRVICSVDVAWYKGDKRVNFFVISVSENGKDFSEVYSGKSSGETLQLETYQFVQTSARYVKVTVNGNSINSWASITEMDVYGYAASLTDSTPPLVKITSPEDGSTISNNNYNTKITVEGTASDDASGVKIVEVKVDDQVYLAAIPKAPGDWSSWSITVDLVSPGEHRIVPRATDNAGNQAWNSIYVTLEDGENNNNNDSNTALDKFGIKQIYPTKSAGREWFANWDNGVKRTLYFGDRDPSNPEFIVRGEGSVSIDGNGNAIMKGSAPRMYIYDEAREKKWHNVEITYYAKRISESSTLSYQGFAAGTRSEHQDVTSSDPCNGKTYYGKMMYDGRVAFQKEIMHGKSYSSLQPQPISYPWDTADKKLPKEQWIGYKFIVKNTPDNKHVNLQLYWDLTGGIDGGNWEKLIEYTDAGSWRIEDSDVSSCKGVTSDHILLDPGTSTFIRNDGISEAHYKQLSVREIEP